MRKKPTPVAAPTSAAIIADPAARRRRTLPSRTSPLRAWRSPGAAGRRFPGQRPGMIRLRRFPRVVPRTGLGLLAAARRCAGCSAPRGLCTTQQWGRRKRWKCSPRRATGVCRFWLLHRVPSWRGRCTYREGRLSFRHSPATPSEQGCQGKTKALRQLRLCPFSQ